MPQQLIPEKILNWNPKGRRKRGRPHKSWREGIDKENRKKGLEEDTHRDREE